MFIGRTSVVTKDWNLQNLSLQTVTVIALYSIGTNGKYENIFFIVKMLTIDIYSKINY